MTRWNHVLPAGGRVNQGENITALDVSMRIAAALPGPGQYHIKRNPEQPGGRFNLSKAKTDVEWKMYRASKIPGPGEYPVHTMDPRTIGGARIQGGRFDESRPKNDIEWRAYNASGRVNPEGQPGPGQYDTFNPPKMLDPAAPLG
jgi:hypothetical protein